jgi:hypothetical protein
VRFSYTLSLLFAPDPGISVLEVRREAVRLIVKLMIKLRGEAEKIFEETFSVSHKRAS